MENFIVKIKYYKTGKDIIIHQIGMKLFIHTEFGILTGDKLYCPIEDKILDRDIAKEYFSLLDI